MMTAAPPALLQLFSDPSTTAAQKESSYLSSVFGDSTNGISASLKLALYGVGLAKHQWFTPNTSYCTWAGISCCMTGSEVVLEYCSSGLNSVSWILLPGVGMAGQIPSDMMMALSDLQLLIVDGNTGLVGPFPNMSSDGASKFQAWSIESTGFSQPCSINSPKWGGTAADINVQDMQDLSQYENCMPNFLNFDTTADIRVAYSDTITCPTTKWVIPPATASDTVSASSSFAGGHGNLLEFNPSPKLYSFAGCSCSDSQDYTATTYVDSQGERAIKCVHKAPGRPWLPFVIIICGIVGLVVVATGISIWLLRSSIIRDVRVWELNRLKSRKPPGTLPLGAGKGLGLVDKEITMVISDVEGSTDLWELCSGAMSKALESHDKLLRQILKKFYGSEVTTEGDSFTMAFHDAIDAVGFAMHLQEAMLDVSWPSEILADPHACLVTTASGQKLFNGLRVRLAIHTGVPSSVQEVHGTHASKAPKRLSKTQSYPTDPPSQGERTSFAADLPSAEQRSPPKRRMPWHNPIFPDESAGSNVQLIGAKKSWTTRSRSYISRIPGAEDAQERLLSEMHASADAPMDVTVIDQGSFVVMEFDVQDASPDGPVISGVQALQILPSRLACRALQFPAIDATLQVAPSFFDAPAAAIVQLPGRLFPDGPAPSVTIAFCNCCSFKEVAAVDAKLAQRAQAKYKSCVRTTLRLASGYECQDLQGVFMLAFKNATDAVCWAMLLNLALLRVDWDDDMLANISMKEVKDADGQTVLKGMSAAVGICHGPVIKVCPHSTTGRADYFGTTLNRAARIFNAAQAGQVLLETELADEVAKDLESQILGPTAGGLADLNFRLLSEAYAKAHELPGLRTDQRLTSDIIEPDQEYAPKEAAVSNIFRTKSTLGRLNSTGSRLSSTSSSIPIVNDPQPPSQSPHWTIQVPSEEVSAGPLLQNGLNNLFTNPLASKEVASHETSDEPQNPSSLLLTSSLDSSVDPLQQPTRNTGSSMSKESSKAPRGASDSCSASQKRFSLSMPAGTAAESQRRWQAVEVEVYSLGSFAFKGMGGQWQIAQVLPSSLTARLELFSHVLKRGKATCTRQDDSQLHSVKMWLPEISGLQLAR
ncbi:hypothetical protein WJX74_000339 [Apatococcus lobatus]|uniref:Guanylate cyclase domain-containing protein n=1 Tax=Apatococcus lobatus TaxID=904363 RepID=A0AAW1RNV3_9CHLO